MFALETVSSLTDETFVYETRHGSFSGGVDPPPEESRDLCQSQKGMAVGVESAYAR